MNAPNPRIPSMKTCLLTVLLAAGLPAFAETQFPTPEAAVEALVKAVAARDQAQLADLFGPDYQEFSSGQQSDPALAHARMDRFEAALKQFRSLDRESDDRYSLVVGAMGWPFPIPIIRAGDRWQFDGKEGVEELRNRVIGANELNAIAVLDAYVAAQRAYSFDDFDGDGVVEYAQRVTSTPGQRDGLYWEIEEDDPEAVESPLGPLRELGDAVLGEREVGAPLLGYNFRVLSAQGPNAKAGAYDYRINGHMVGGFAMIAWPANYGETGIMSFIVNQDGVIYQHDFGEETAAAADTVTKFDPGEGWAEVDDDALAGHVLADVKD